MIIVKCSRGWGLDILVDVMWRKQKKSCACESSDAKKKFVMLCDHIGKNEVFVALKPGIFWVIEKKSG